MKQNFISEAEYNTRWWGKKFGKIESVDFFKQDLTQATSILNSFDVAEFSTEDSANLTVTFLRKFGFWHADTQVPFRIGLGNFADNTKLSCFARDINLVPASKKKFSISVEELPPFEAERFWQLDGINKAKMDTRYSNWSQDLVKAYPEYCFEAFLNDKSIGWFLGQPSGSSSVELTLAMLRPQSFPIGTGLYEAALHTFSQMGARIGQAGFSINNTAVLNIYSKLGAKFQSPVHNWLWQKSR